MYRTHLFGKPSVIVFLPAVSKFVFRDDKSFILKWPNIELVGETSVVSVHGSAHKRLRSFVSRSINQPDARFEPGPVLDKLDEYFAGMVKGFRASRLNIPGSTFYHALQVFLAHQLKNTSVLEY